MIPYVEVHHELFMADFIKADIYESIFIALKLTFESGRHEVHPEEMDGLG